jgi:hypothetical protein
MSGLSDLGFVRHNNNRHSARGSHIRHSALESHRRHSALESHRRHSAPARSPRHSAPARSPRHSALDAESIGVQELAGQARNDAVASNEGGEA